MQMIPIYNKKADIDPTLRETHTKTQKLTDTEWTNSVCFKRATWTFIMKNTMTRM